MRQTEEFYTVGFLKKIFFLIHSLVLGLAIGLGAEHDLDMPVQILDYCIRDLAPVAAVQSIGNAEERSQFAHRLAWAFIQVRKTIVFGRWQGLAVVTSYESDDQNIVRGDHFPRMCQDHLVRTLVMLFAASGFTPTDIVHQRSCFEGELGPGIKIVSWLEGVENLKRQLADMVNMLRLHLMFFDERKHLRPCF